ncbi:OLC1v1018895C1 [Oldenlandia corymbosa var. corymbosa]|uniref:OLC1v1018895C1 n=1 Tax=Oldenlandia corymbosa var. corymbosa TaxID=529605 RepID=A0AAV1ECR8_OLDCO|nr:OLC1v1018895C1 [Oldenlandia corymbosa var. corymbosa]
MAFDGPYFINVYWSSKYVEKNGIVNTFNNLRDDSILIDQKVAGTSRSHLEVGTSSGGPNMENGDHMEDNHVEDDELDDEDYTSISEQSNEHQPISEGSRESDKEVEDNFATSDRHIYHS